MKTALCFSGLPRNVKDTYESIHENLLEPNDIKDVFIHTWTCEDGADIGNKWESYIYDKSSKAYMLEKYSPVCYLEESQENLKNKPNYLPNTLLNLYQVSEVTTCFDKQSQFCSLFESIRLVSEYQKKHGFVYDMVVKLRFDLIFFSPIIVKDLNPRVLHVSDFMTNMDTGLLVNDWLAIGNYDNMQKYAEVWNNLRKLLEQDVIFHSEELVAKNLENYNIEICQSFKNEIDHNLWKYQK